MDLRPSLSQAVAVVLVLAAGAGCGYAPRIPGVTPYRMEIQQGNFVSQEMVAQLKPGMTKDQVRFILGTPMVTDIFHADRWDYIYWREASNGSAREPQGDRPFRERAARAHRRRRARHRRTDAVRIAVAGAGGRMGRALIDAVLADRALVLAAAFDVPASPVIGARFGSVEVVADAPAAIRAADVLVDFTRPEGTLGHLAHAKAMVIGTTGFSEKDRAAIAEAASGFRSSWRRTSPSA